jgi:uncharacterized protein YacL
MSWFIPIRVAFIVVVGFSAYRLHPLEGGALANAGFGAVLGAVIVTVEALLRQVTLQRIVGAVAGGIVGLLLARTAGAALYWADPDVAGVGFIQTVLILALPYIGVIVGVRRSDWLSPSRLSALFRGGGPERRFRLLDTSVIIDGRIADICETGFVDGALVVPQFVLKELQLVADSSDTLKRNRGRRGLDVLQKIQKMDGVEVIVSDLDFPEVREVDQKLIEAARKLDGKIVTNDFNLNKVAHVRGVEVLNINDLANSLKPVVLPGELMSVFILKEGKEHNQGVAYLDDGTMVVVDNARKLIGKTIEIVVTSVLQTTAGKMIFGRSIEQASNAPAQTAVVAGTDVARRSRPASQQAAAAGK